MKTIEAIYENGVLRPLQPVPWLEEHRPLTLMVLDTPRPSTIAECVGILPDEDARQMRAAIDAEFEQVDPNEWK